MTTAAPAPAGSGAPAPARPRRRWARPALVAGALVAGALLALAAGLWGVNAVRDLARWATAGGRLEWYAAEGNDWQAITRADARRREWSPDTAFLSPAWEVVAPGLRIADLPVRRPPNPLSIPIFLARIDPASWRFRVWGGPAFDPGTVTELAVASGMSLAVNASYFSDDGPLGLIVSDGSARGRQGKNRAAHFVVPKGAASPRIVNEKGAKLGPLEQGLQGFPAIMSAATTYPYMRYGGRGFNVDKVERRTAACVLRGGDVLLLVTDTLANGLSLAELATVLGGLGCADAMGFDGGGSTGMALRIPGHTRTVLSVEKVPVILGIEPR